MKNLIDFFVNYKHWFVFTLLEVISLFFLFTHNGYQKSVYFTTANGVVGSVYNVISSVSSYIGLKTANLQLEKENEELRRQIVGLKQQLVDIGVDSLQVENLSAEYKLVNAQVVNSTVHRSANLITINKGEADGIRPEMGVVSSSGIVGIVYMTSKHYSIVMPVISIHSKISCRIKGSEYFGSLIWKRGSPDIAYATSIPRHAQIKKGDIIETNGYSDIFPPNIPIGYSFKTMNSEDGMSYTLKVQLYTDFKNLREVSVITNYASPERTTLEEAAESLNLDDEVEDVKTSDKKTEEAVKVEESTNTKDEQKGVSTEMQVTSEDVNNQTEVSTSEDIKVEPQQKENNDEVTTSTSQEN